MTNWTAYTWTRTDEHMGRVTIRRHYRDGEFYRADVYLAGHRIGDYRTEAGAMRRATREHEIDQARSRRCTEHPAYEADYCPVCGTARVIGGSL